MHLLPQAEYHPRTAGSMQLSCIARVACTVRAGRWSLWMTTAICEIKMRTARRTASNNYLIWTVLPIMALLS